MRKYTFVEGGNDPPAMHTVIIEPEATYFRLVAAPTSAPPPGYALGKVRVDGGTPQSISLNEGQSQIDPFSEFSFVSVFPGTFVFAIGVGEELRTENVVISQAVAPPPPVSFNTLDGSVPAGGWLALPQRLLELPFPTQRVSVDLCTLAPGLLVVQDGTTTQGIPLPAGSIYRIPSVNGSYIDIFIYNSTAAAITVGWLMLFDAL